MADTRPSQNDTRCPSFQQQDTSAWISFDPVWTGHRRDVRSAAAKSSAAARKATIARKLAMNAERNGQQTQEASKRPSKQRREQRTPSTVSSASSATLSSRRKSEVSLVSLSSINSPSSSGTSSPCFTQAPQTPACAHWTSESAPFPPMAANLPSPQLFALQQAVCFVLGIEMSLREGTMSREPTHFGASRVKSWAINSVHDAVTACRAGSATLLAVALLAAWDLRFGDARSSSLNLCAWHELALPQGVLPFSEGSLAARITLAEAIQLSLQCHLDPKHYSEVRYVFDCMPMAYTQGQVPSGKETVFFFDLIGDLVGFAPSP